MLLDGEAADPSASDETAAKDRHDRALLPQPQRQQHQETQQLQSQLSETSPGLGSTEGCGSREEQPCGANNGGASTAWLPPPPILLSPSPGNSNATVVASVVVCDAGHAAGGRPAVDSATTTGGAAADGDSKCDGADMVVLAGANTGGNRDRNTGSGSGKAAPGALGMSARSHGIVLRLSVLFATDSFAGSLVTGTLLAYYFQVCEI